MNTAVIVSSSYLANYSAKTVRTGEKTEAAGAFQAELANRAQKKEYPSAIEDYKRRNPGDAAHVDKQVRLGKLVLSRNGAEHVDRDSMTMEEYKQFFTGLMNSIPYDWSQQNDVNVWSISEKGWEQMKNDPDYEAWVLGYTSEDRAVHIPWAAMPGYSPQYHTEKFGASIDEHLGQGFPMNSPSDKTSGDGSESWWVKRMKMHKKLLEEQAKLAYDSSKFVGKFLFL